MESEVAGQATSEGTRRDRVTILCGLSLAVVSGNSRREKLRRDGITITNQLHGNQGMVRINQNRTFSVGNISIKGH